MPIKLELEALIRNFQGYILGERIVVERCYWVSPTYRHKRSEIKKSIRFPKVLGVKDRIPCQQITWARESCKTQMNVKYN